ncbi:RING Finger Ubiquitin ligase [Phytophthora palmivora]|uniref:RING Finger Ubiquitin ligase n=1 Tax=Phytophthora palmivora TaxID=4796 RepID=A0A2P4X321_9STRA|nr:RING Finger Ubiquitin ligase [Phytophthora palmivora]
MFLRSLYGSRMPQALHPRVDPHASSYWEEDTASSREIARAMEEADTSDTEPEDGGKKKSSVLAAVDEHVSRRLSIPTLSSQLAALLGPDGMALEDMEGLSVDDMTSSPVHAQLSPAGLISIAAADIDEAASNNSQNVPPVNGELDLAFIRSLREVSTEDSAEGPRTPSHVVNTALSQLLGSLPTSRGSISEETAADAEAVESENNLFSLVRRHLKMLGSNSSSVPMDEAEDNAAEGQSKLRFLSLLRRINELRSQQVDSESWDGLPYPQIIALPTFKYQFRERHDNENQADEDGDVNNTVCAVCCDEFEAEEEVRALPCLHFYHRECIDQWLMYHRQCPICKHVVAVY